MFRFSQGLTSRFAIAWNKIDLILALDSFFLVFRFVFKQCVCILQCLEELTNSRYQIVSPEFYSLYIQDFCPHSSQNVVYNTLSKELAKLLYLSCRSMCRMTNSVSRDSFLNLCLAIKSMFSTTSCVCVNLGSLRIHQFFLNERWYKLWLKIAITCFSDTRFTRKIISALYIDICISKQAKFINFIATATWSRSSPSFSSSSCRRRQRKRLLLKVPNFENSQLPSFNLAFRELATHKYGPGSTPGPKVKCGLNLLLILALLWGLFFHFCFFSLHKNQVEHF